MRKKSFGLQLQLKLQCLVKNVFLNNTGSKMADTYPPFFNGEKKT